MPYVTLFERWVLIAFYPEEPPLPFHLNLRPVFIVHHLACLFFLCRVALCCSSKGGNSSEDYWIFRVSWFIGVSWTMGILDLWTLLRDYFFTFALVYLICPVLFLCNFHHGAISTTTLKLFVVFDIILWWKWLWLKWHFNHLWQGFPKLGFVKPRGFVKELKGVASWWKGIIINCIIKM